MITNTEHYYTIDWDTCGKDGRKRHYCRHLTDRDKTIRKAREINGRPGTERTKVREMMSWDEGPVTHIRFLGYLEY